MLIFSSNLFSNSIEQLFFSIGFLKIDIGIKYSYNRLLALDLESKCFVTFLIAYKF